MAIIVIETNETDERQFTRSIIDHLIRKQATCLSSVEQGEVPQYPAIQLYEMASDEMVWVDFSDAIALRALKKIGYEVNPAANALIEQLPKRQARDGDDRRAA